MTNDMTGRVAVVTGGASGIGFATARDLALRGATAIICDIDGDRARSSAESLVAEGLAAAGYQLDVSDRASCAEVVGQVSARHGPVAILVNNAGIAGTARLGDAHSAEQWDRSIAVNLTGMYNIAVACLPGLKETRGAVVNISSVVAFTSGFAQAGYAASKGGVRSLTQAMCRELTRFGIRVNGVAPGYVETPMTASGKDKFAEWLEFHCPMQRYGKPEELAKAIVFLCSDDASFVNGATLPVDGGYLAV
ncbi:SDR family NAD(P)-dependent oxidoreductase [Paracoccus pantotrophus]|uniref:SDR family NAD(P)-dependent oxidoreductase n=1 Tax=Paracoccus pantotrophus TaxID=82367 RepID=UPI00049071F9|nr:SDR family NAD(P)-dependent oxidoreductase [Paracoccus pantotrophus]